MRRLMKRVSRSLAGLVMVGAGLIVVGLLMSSYKRDRLIALPTAALEVDLADGSIEQGAYLFRTRGCVDCHGADGGGRQVVDDGGLLVVGPNLTPGGRQRGAAVSGA
ncbi:c-type cytochrome [Duganella lactea]|uniref:c-type cytochrome n=1 Tax=Duganella lactea TaxID=2692173 RepID=UPI001E2CA5D5|nr:c-type cytochrome [Duganella lactea]